MACRNHAAHPTILEVKIKNQQELQDCRSKQREERRGV
jgi:hypothetical protein